MDRIVLDTIPFDVNLAQLLSRLRIAADSPYAEEVLALVRDAEAIGRPKALCRLAFIEARGEDWIRVNHVVFTSRVLSVNTTGVHRVFAYVATCGSELDAWAESVSDILHRYWTEVVREMALRSATTALDDYLVEHYRLGRTSTMSPGRLADWPLREQAPLFTLLGDPGDAIGVRLTDSYLMVPTKSVSGMRFPTEVNFESCQLCPRHSCPNRKAPYDEDLFDRRYRAATS